MITPSFGLTATERVLPKLALDFTTASLDSRVTFTRTTGASNPATYVNSSGVITAAANDAPRFDYDPVTLVCKGLLIEESRTNSCLYSSEFDNANWLKTEISVSQDVITSPDGTVNADKLIYSANNSVHNIRKTGLTSAAYSASVYAKAGEETVFSIWLRSAAVFAVFDLSTGTITSKSASVTASITDSGNGWYRCVAYDPTAGTTLHIYGRNGGAFSGNGVDGLYLWGAQLEAGAFATSYIPTTTTALTRNADVATITGTAFSGFWRSGPGSILARALPSTVSGTRPWVQVDDTTANEIIALRGNTTNPELYIVDGGSPQAQIDAGTIAANTVYRLAGAWATNSCAASLNGGASVLDGVATIPTVTQMRLGSDGTNYLNGRLQSLEYYDVRLSNADLQTVSSTAGYQSIVQPVLKNTIVSDIITELV